MRAPSGGGFPLSQVLKVAMSLAVPGADHRAEVGTEDLPMTPMRSYLSVY